MTRDEVATVLGVKPETVTRYIIRGLIHAEKHGRDYWITPKALETFKQTRRKPGNPGTPRGPRKKKEISMQKFCEYGQHNVGEVKRVKIHSGGVNSEGEVIPAQWANYCEECIRELQNEWLEGANDIATQDDYHQL